ncbi:MAG: glycosyltransferase family 4 protein [Firmicutes bacterium]|nr:glycosyltransferase family 4 protein [Bacillota bacterium]
MDRPLVALVLPYLERAGTERHASHLVNALSERYEFILIAPDGPAKSFFGKDLAHLSFARLEKAPLRGLRELRRALSQIKEMARSRRALIHVHAAPELLVISKIANPGLPHLLTIHGFHGSGMDFSYRFAAWAGNLFAAEVVCVSSDEERRLTASGLRRHKLNLIYNGIPDLPAEPRPNGGRASDGSPIIGCVARLERPKGLEYLLRAAGRLSAEGRNFRVVIVGGGSDEARLRAIAAEYPGLRIDFAGMVDDPAPYYAEFAVFVLPSLTDPLPIAAIEAMRAGLPVVATRVGGLQEMVVDGETGFLVPPAEPGALAEAIEKLLDDPPLRRRMGEAGRRRYLTLFNLKAMADSTAKIYARLLNPDFEDLSTKPR